MRRRGRSGRAARRRRRRPAARTAARARSGARPRSRSHPCRRGGPRGRAWRGPRLPPRSARAAWYPSGRHLGRRVSAAAVQTAFRMRKALLLFGDVRPASTGLATAFFRFYLLDALSSAPARPATLLAHVAAERLPFATGAFGRALQSLLEGGHLVPAREGMVALTALGAAERMVERERSSAVMPTVMRLLGDVAPRPAPAIAEPFMPIYRAKVADAYQERVLVAYVRDRVASAREGGRPFCVALVAIGIDHQNEATRRAMVHRTILASL